jgi:hypothetical protein
VVVYQPLDQLRVIAHLDGLDDRAMRPARTRPPSMEPPIVLTICAKAARIPANLVVTR